MIIFVRLFVDVIYFGRCWNSNSNKKKSLVVIMAINAIMYSSKAALAGYNNEIPLVLIFSYFSFFCIFFLRKMMKNDNKIVSTTI